MFASLLRPQIRAIPLVILASLIVSTSFQVLHADVVTLQAAKDNTIFSEDNALSNGAGDHFFAGRTNNATLRRGLIAFDLAGQIPPGSTINAVTLTLYKSRGKGGGKDISLYRLESDWGEGTSDAANEEGQGAPATTNDATWDRAFFPSTLWTTPGGDYVGTLSAVTSVGSNGLYTWSSNLMRDDVQGWLDVPSSNYGWILLGDESTNTTARRFDSRTNPTVSQRPQLQIDFTPPFVSGACCLPDDSCALLSETDCLNQSGTYQGDGTVCTPNPCVVATGACCFNDGTCQELSAADCATQGGSYNDDGSTCVPDLCPLVLTPFIDPLPIPQPATPTSGTVGGVATYDMAMTQFQQQLHSELPPTTVWGYGGAFPGPTIEASVGQTVTVNWINDLRDSQGALRTDHFLPVDLCMHGPDTEGNTPRTVVHLHGGHVPPEYDGYPESTFLPGQQATYIYENNQLPATLWYHDHAIGITRLNVIMGLAGFYLLRDSFEQGLGLPAGEFEIPLAIQDRSFNSDGSLKYPAIWQDLFFGDKILVNGKVWPFLNVKRGKYRFRVLNGSNSRVYTLSLSPQVPLWVIGTEGGLLPEPVRRDTLTLTTGERADVIIDFEGLSPNTEILLVNTAPAPFPGPPGEGVVSDVMKFITEGGGGAFTGPLPTTLRPIERLEEGLALVERDFVLEKTTDACAGSKWLINGLKWTDPITEFPELGTTEMWSFINQSGMTHPMHMHLVMFQVLDRQAFTVEGGQIVPQGPRIPPDSSEAGWKDTAPVGPNEILRVIARFEGYTGKYAYHCHIIEHEDHEMMRQFEVVDLVTGVPDYDAARYILSPVQPNPFNPSVVIPFELPQSAEVRIGIYDVAGRLVRTLVDGVRPAGPQKAVWDGRNDDGTAVTSGVYFVRMRSGDFSSVRKAVLLK